ncbi:MAG: hypothetical protein ACREBF_02890 [Candidatus Micrarchaeales archaeon]
MSSTKPHPLNRKNVSKTLVSNIKKQVIDSFYTAARKSAKLASLRLNRLDANSLDNPKVYKEFKSVTKLVEKAAMAFDSANKKSKSKKYWGIAATLHLQMLMEGLRDSEKSELKLKERTENAISALKAAKRSSDMSIFATAVSTAENVLKLYNSDIAKADTRLQELINVLKKSER